PRATIAGKAASHSRPPGRESQACIAAGISTAAILRDGGGPGASYTREPGIDLPAAGQSDASLIGHRRIGEHRPVSATTPAKGPQRPPDDRLAREEHAPCLDIAVPQGFTPDDARDCPTDHLAMDDPARQVKPDDGVAAVEDEEVLGPPSEIVIDSPTIAGR